MVVNRNGLELLKQLKEIPLELEELLNKKELPPKFSEFLTLYKVGYQSVSYEKVVLNDEDLDEYLLSKITMYDDEVVNGIKYSGSLDYIFPYEKIREELEKFHNKAEKWNELGCIQIGLMHYNDVLLLGVENDKADEIWRYGQGVVGSITSKLETDIFSFMKRLNESILYDDLEDWKIKPRNLYKRLGENFWRVDRNNLLT